MRVKRSPENATDGSSWFEIVLTSLPKDSAITFSTTIITPSEAIITTPDEQRFCANG